MTPYLRRVRAATATAPALTVYVAAVLLGAGSAGHLFRLDVAALALALVVVLVIQASMHREVSTVHRLVNSQHDALVDRVDQLVAALTDAGVQIPHDPTNARGKR